VLRVAGLRREEVGGRWAYTLGIIGHRAPWPWVNNISMHITLVIYLELSGVIEMIRMSRVVDECTDVVFLYS